MSRHFYLLTVKCGIITFFSHSVIITSTGIPKPVFTVSPSWPSSGDSLTLNCSVKDPSAGWRFYWYKAVPTPSNNYRFELLPGSSNGTIRDSYAIHGQTRTAGYLCRAGRGNPVYYTHNSELKFVWSGGRFVLDFSLPLTAEGMC